MADFALPKKNVAYEFEVSLISQTNTKLLQTNPTLAAGDVKVQTDDGTLANITTLPTSAAASKRVKVSLSAAEMNGDNVYIQFSDAAGDEWCDTSFNVQTAARATADLAITGAAMTLTTGERTAVATEVESHLLDEGDAQMLINAIVGAIGNTNIDEAILVAAIRADLERIGGAIKLIQGKTDSLTFTVASQLDVNLLSWRSEQPLVLTSGLVNVDTHFFGGMQGMFFQGRPNVDVTHSGGAALGALSGDKFVVIVETNNDKTGYSLAIAPPTLTDIRDGITTDHGIGSYVRNTEPVDPTAALDAIGTALLEVWQNSGLDAANPVTITPTQRAFGTVVIQISGDGVTSSILTRQ